MNRRIIIITITVIAALIIMRIAGSATKKAADKKPVEQSEVVFKEAVKLQNKNPDKAVEALEDIIIKYPQSTQAQKALMKIADFYKSKEEVLLEKETLQRLIDNFAGSDLAKVASERLGDINIKMLFSQAQTKDSLEYEVKPGDSLYKIAKRYKTNVELLMRVNGLSGSLIKPGMKLKIITAPFEINVNKSERILTLKTGGEVIKVYPVGLGADNSTPVGEFKVVNRIVNPVWYKTGAIVPAGSAENILGTRWLGISEPGYGIHGTVDKQPIQKQTTQGCVRMQNEDVQELFDIVPVGTKVTITD